MTEENKSQDPVTSSDDKILGAWQVMDRMFAEMNFTVLEAVTTLVSLLGTTLVKALPPEKHDEAIDELIVELRAMIAAIIEEDEEEKKKGLN